MRWTQINSHKAQHQQGQVWTSAKFLSIWGEQKKKCVDLINKVILTELRDRAARTTGNVLSAIGCFFFEAFECVETEEMTVGEKGKLCKILQEEIFSHCWGITRIKMSTIGTSLFLLLFCVPFHHKMFVSTYSTVMTVIPWFSSVRFSRRHRRARSYARVRERQPSEVWSKMRITLRGLINDCEMKNRQKFFIAVTLLFYYNHPSLLARPQKANRYGKHFEWQTEKQLE